MDLENLVGMEARYGEHFQDTRLQLLSHLLQLRVGARPVHRRDDCGDGIAYARNLRKPIPRNKLFQWLPERGEAVRSPHVRSGSIGIAAGEA